MMFHPMVRTIAQAITLAVAASVATWAPSRHLASRAPAKGARTTIDRWENEGGALAPGALDSQRPG